MGILGPVLAISLVKFEERRMVRLQERHPLIARALHPTASPPHYAPFMPSFASAPLPSCLTRYLICSNRLWETGQCKREGSGHCAKWSAIAPFMTAIDCFIALQQSAPVEEVLQWLTMWIGLGHKRYSLYGGENIARIWHWLNVAFCWHGLKGGESHIQIYDIVQFLHYDKEVGKWVYVPKIINMLIFLFRKNKWAKPLVANSTEINWPYF